MRKIKSIFGVFTVLLFAGIFSTEAEAAAKTVSQYKIFRWHITKKKIISKQQERHFGTISIQDMERS